MPDRTKDNPRLQKCTEFYAKIVNKQSKRKKRIKVKKYETIERRSEENPNKTRNKIILFIAVAVFTALSLTALIFGALNGVHGVYVDSQAKLVLLAGVIGLVSVALPFLLKIIFRLEISLSIVLMWWIFVLAHGLGEALELYYKIPAWDKLLHLTSGILQFVTVYALARSYFSKRTIDRKTFLCIVFAVAVSLAIATLWEIFEFTIDSLFGTNMQKVIPDEFFNGGNTTSDLLGETSAIGEFYKTPEGYRYALVDTMYDCVSCLGGTIIAGIGMAVLTKFRPHLFESAFKVTPRKGKVEVENA